MKKRSLANWCVCLVATSFIVVCVERATSAQAKKGANDGINSFKDLAEYCARPSVQSLSVPKLQRTEAFVYVWQHLDEVLDEKQSVASSEPLSALVWRAAFLFGTRAQIAKAVEVCWSHRAVGGGTWIPMDLAQDAHLMLDVLLSENTPIEVREDLLGQISDRHPGRWGFYDYTMTLKLLMESDQDVSLRCHAAYCLGRWAGDSEVGLEARSMLQEHGSTNGICTNLFGRIQTLGTHGWQAEPSTQTAE